MATLTVRMPSRASEDYDQDALLVFGDGTEGWGPATIPLGSATNGWELLALLQQRGGCSFADVEFENEAFCRFHGWLTNAAAVALWQLGEVRKLLSKEPPMR